VSDVRDQVERVRAESEVPADATQEKPLEPDTPPDRTRQFTHTSFSRVKTEWKASDQEAVMILKAEADRVVRQQMNSAYAVMERIRRCVRTPATVTDAQGERTFLAHPDGSPVWEKDEFDVPVEDWGLLTDRTRESLMFTITTHLFEWGMGASDAWAEAMYAKVNWEEAFARGFIALPPGVVSGRPTIDDRTQWGHRTAVDDRYFAVFKSAVSRKSDVVISTMKGLLRLLENTVVR
jgi:hypothetical protein